MMDVSLTSPLPDTVQELNLTEVYRVGRDLVDQLKMPEAERGWKQFMGRKVADFGFTLGDMLQKLDTRLIVVGRISDTEFIHFVEDVAEPGVYDLELFSHKTPIQ